MIDLSKTIIAKSDQLNADDLIGGGVTVKIRKVELKSEEQPVSIYYEGDDGKPFKPCKSMRRVLVACWGQDGNKYIGRSLTLYRDASVAFGGQNVGGIRISHLSDIDKPITLSLTATKKSKKPHTVQPLVLQNTPKNTPPTKAIDETALYEYALTAAESGMTSLESVWKALSKEEKQSLSKRLPELKVIAQKADTPPVEEYAFGLPAIPE